MKNVYELLSEELSRMHWMLDKSINSTGGSNNAKIFYERILKIQDSVLEMAKSSDPEIQKAIAELALTGSTDASNT